MNLLKRFPSDIGRIDIIDANFPLVHGQANFLGVRGGGIFAYGAGFAIDKSPRIGRIFQDLQDGGNGGLFPHHIAKAIPSRQAEIVCIEKLQDEAFRSEPQEGRKHESRRSWISRWGSLCTLPMASRTRPMGSDKANSPRCALLRSPAVMRARMVCNSSSANCPLRPSSKRPLAEPGS